MAVLGIFLLLFACFAFMATGGEMMGFNVEGGRKVAPAVLGLIFLMAGVSMINRT
ncbi:MAG: hypothetical protein ACJA1O_002933 [Spirosomataceae bacterium]|jgi:hypothetical protein